MWGIDEGSAEVKQLGPLPGVLRARDLPVGAVHERVSAIPQQPAFGDLGSVQLLSHHGLNWIAPEGNDRTKSYVRRMRHSSPPNTYSPPRRPKRANLDQTESLDQWAQHYSIAQHSGPPGAVKRRGLRLSQEFDASHSTHHRHQPSEVLWRFRHARVEEAGTPPNEVRISSSNSIFPRFNSAAKLCLDHASYVC